MGKYARFYFFNLNSLVVNQIYFHSCIRSVEKLEVHGKLLENACIHLYFSETFLF